MMDTAARRLLLADAVFSRLMDSLTGGTILAGLGLLVGCDNLELALLASLPFLAQVAQLPAMAILLRWSDRRRIVVAAAGTSRLILIGVAALLVVAPDSFGPVGLLAALGAAALLTVVATTAWNWWMRDLVPASELGSVFGARLRMATVVSLVAMLAAGAALDAFARNGGDKDGYALLFALGGVAGLLGVVALARTPHVAPPPSPPAARSIRLLPAAIRAAPMPLLASLSLASLAASFALPFAAIFLLRGLGYGFLAVTAMAVTSQVAYLAGLRGWAHVSDRHGDRALLAISIALLGMALAGWTLAGWPPGLALTAWLFVLHFLSGFALGGIELASTNLLLRSSPAQGAAAHLAGVSLVRAAACGAGVLVAGLAWQVLGAGVLWQTDLAVVGAWSLRGFQVLTGFSLALALAAAAATARLGDTTHGRIAEVARSMRREVHQMSSIAGIRGLIHAVSYSVELMAWPFAARLRTKPTRGEAAPPAAPPAEPEPSPR